MRFLARGQLHRRLEHAGFDVIETGGSQALGRELRRGELPGAWPALEVLAVWGGSHQATGTLADAGDIRAGSALGDQPATRVEGLKDGAKESGVVADPVEGGVAE